MEIHNYCEKNYNIDCKSFRKNKKKTFKQISSNMSEKMISTQNKGDMSNSKKMKSKMNGKVSLNTL